MHVLRGETETKACSSVYWLVFTFKRIYSYMYAESQSQWTVLLVMRVFVVSIVSLLIAYSPCTVASLYGEQAPDQWQLFDVDDVYKMSGAWGKG